MKLFILILYIFIGSVTAVANPINLSPYIIRGQAQGSTYEVKYFANKEIISKNDLDSIFRVIDESMSLYQSQSLISKFNSSSTNRVKLDTHMYNVVTSSLYYHKITKGYFDISIFPLLKLWGFGPEGFSRNPTYSQVDSVKKFVGIDKIKLKGKTLIKKHKNVSIDLNGIAQGYTVDVICDYFNKKNVPSYIIEVGGEIYCKGHKPEGESYKVEIQRPYGYKGDTYKVVLKDKAITTSGSYEKYRIVDGKRISHHINPKTGTPLTNNTLSVTVLANSAMEADALDNYLMYLKPTEAIAFIENIKDCEAYIIYSENNTLKELQSSGFNNYIYK